MAGVAGGSVYARTEPPATLTTTERETAMPMIDPNNIRDILDYIRERMADDTTDRQLTVEEVERRLIALVPTGWHMEHVCPGCRLCLLEGCQVHDTCRCGYACWCLDCQTVRIATGNTDRR
jgi:hypothetical protein